MPILGPICFTSHSLLCNGQNARQTLSAIFVLFCFVFTHYCEAFGTNKILSVLVFIFLLSKTYFFKNGPILDDFLN